MPLFHASPTKQNVKDRREEPIQHLCKKNSEKVFNESKKLLVLYKMVEKSPLTAFLFVFVLYLHFQNDIETQHLFSQVNFLYKWLVQTRVWKMRFIHNQNWI